MLFFLSTAFFAFAEVRAAPTRYDQRQDGDFNLHGQLDNFLFVAVFPSKNTPLLSEITWDDVEHGISTILSRSKEQGLIKSGEEVHQDEPHTVEIVQINENRPGKESSVRKAEGDAETSNVSDQQPTSIGDGQAEKAERVARNVKNFEFPKSREVPTIPGYFVDVRKMFRPKTGDSGRARNVVGNVWHLDVEPVRPGTSLKKQLPRRGGEDVAPSSNADKNDVPSFAEEKQQELRLLGDGIENCGPGRRRDASGVCQFDGSAGSLL